MLASNLSTWDIGVYNPHHQLVLIVEIKTKLNTTADWVIYLRNNIFSVNKIPKIPYFLMAFPDTFYLWTEKDLQIANSQPTYIIDARPILDPIYEKVGISDYKMEKSSFELIMFSWLRRIINLPHPSNLIDSSQDWLIESGLYTAIVGGNLFHEVTI